MVTMAALDLGKYKKFVQYFYDPEPTNASQSPIWCLGREYRVPDKSSSANNMHPSTQTPKSSTIEPSRTQPVTPPDSTSSSVDSNLAYDHSDNEKGGGWPSPFLDDFEARIWFTYRSNFPAIPKSQDPKAQAAMSLPVRIRSQFDKPAGFTSDTGWGCMIRSGQSLLANALVMVRMGRGQKFQYILRIRN
jgi:cysteine protease ATG4